MKKYTYLILVNIAIICISFFILEIMVRTFVPEIKSQGTDKNLIIDSVYYTSQGLRPNTHGMSNGALLTIDKYGFRRNTVEIDTSKNSLLLIGDSVTMGLGIDSSFTFANLLQLRIQKNLLNPSMFGYNVNDYNNVLNHFLTKKELNIDEVILCWCLNDIYDESVNVIETPGGEIRHLFNNLLTYLRRNSRFYLFLKAQVSDRSKSYYDFDSELYLNKNLFSRTLKKLRNIRSECVTRKIKFTLVLLPYEYQIRTQNSFPQNIIEDSLRNSGLITINSYKAFKQNYSKDYFLYGDGIHFSELGHRTLANFIFRQITNDSL